MWYAYAVIKIMVDTFVSTIIFITAPYNEFGFAY